MSIANQGSPSNAIEFADAFGGYLVVVDTNTLRLTVATDVPSRIQVRDDVFYLAALPGAVLTCLITDHTLTAAGLDSGAAPAANTLHHVYVSHGSAKVAQHALRLSTTAPTLIGSSFYLGTSDEALYWRHCGAIVTAVAGGFEFVTGMDNPGPGVIARQARLGCRNRYNKRLITARSFVAYNFDPASSDIFFDVNPTAGAVGGGVCPINAGTADFITYIGDTTEGARIVAATMLSGLTAGGAAPKVQPFFIGVGEGSAFGDASVNDAQLLMSSSTGQGRQPAGAAVPLDGRQVVYHAPPTAAIQRRFASFNAFGLGETTQTYAQVRPHGAALAWLATVIQLELRG